MQDNKRVNCWGSKGWSRDAVETKTWKPQGASICKQLCGEKRGREEEVGLHQLICMGTSIKDESFILFFSYVETLA